jgi:dCMP deaminase
MERLSWDEYALKLASVASERSKDPWKKVGCCLLRHDNSVASLGYNGEPKGVSIDWSNRDERRKRVIHSEVNACRYIKPGECYLAATTMLPCSNCLKTLASYGIKRIIYSEVYDKDDFAIQLAKEFGIELKQIKL